jgi:23S rRNA (cytosine1962-C5)-methyltransferase
MSEGIVTIRPGREKPILQQHPWIFSGAIASARHAEPGDLVTVISSTGDFLARGYWNPKSQIQVRILTWQDEAITDAWWQQMLQRAMISRYPQPQFNVGNRVVNAENDYLPGLIVDRYGDFLVLQALTLYIDLHKDRIARLLAEAFAAAGMTITGVYERSDVDVRAKEGLRHSKGLLWGREPDTTIPFGEEKLTRLVDVRHGHKTGYYLDQIENHRILHQLTLESPIPEPRVLSLFSYTGGFGLAAPAHIVNVDSSAEALDLAHKTYQLNRRPDHLADFVQADVFEYLRAAATQGEQFDIIVCDPPKFAQNKQQIERAARGYKDLNLHCLKLAKPGSYLMTFSCSGAIDADLFQKIVFGALADTGRQAQIIRHLGPSADHPVALTFPEGAYLKGLLLRVY